MNIAGVDTHAHAKPYHTVPYRVVIILQSTINYHHGCIVPNYQRVYGIGK